MSNGIIVSGFVGIGKTKATELATQLGYTATDSDSEAHHWVDGKKENGAIPNWEVIYVDHILELVKEQNFVFCSTHQEVYDELVRRGITFVSVYPQIDTKTQGEFLYRTATRTTGLRGVFGLTLLLENWTGWIKGMQQRTGSIQIELGKGEYLADALPRITEAYNAATANKN